MWARADDERAAISGCEEDPFACATGSGDRALGALDEACACDCERFAVDRRLCEWLCVVVLGCDRFEVERRLCVWLGCSTAEV